MRKALAAAVVAAWAFAVPCASETPSEDPGAKRSRAADLLLEGKAAQAARLYAELLEADPADGAAIAGRVRALHAQGSWREALEEARRRASGETIAPEARAALGEALFRAARIREAASVLEPLAKLSPTPPRALLVLARLRAAEGRDDEALALFERALAVGSEDRDVLFWSSGAAPTRAVAIERLERYLARSEGDDPDRIQGAKDDIKLYRALGERPVWIPLERSERAEIPLRPLGDGAGGVAGYYLEATLGEDRKVRLLLDTGATGLFLVERMARRGGLAPLAETTVFAGGGEGREAEKRGLLPSISLAGLRFGDALATVTSKEIEPTGRYHGVLGLAPFRGYRVVLDLAGSRLLLEPPAEKATGEPYWVVEGQMLVEAEASDGQRGLFLLDTGAARTLVSNDLISASPKPLATKTVSMRIYGSPMEARAVQGLEVAFAGLRSRGEPVFAADLSTRSRLGGVELSGFVGLDLLHGTRIAVDTAAQRVSISKGK